MNYKSFLYKLSLFLSPNFYNQILQELPEKNNITILDVGFYKGEFSKTLITMLKKMAGNVDITVKSFDPNNNVDRSGFEIFSNSLNLDWQHFSIALGNKNSRENFTTLKLFPSSGSSINNILVKSKWLKTRRIIFSPFTSLSNHFETYEIEQKTLDSISLDLPDIDLLKIDVEGYGYEVLQGGTETIYKHNPIIQIEILAKKDDYQISKNKILKFLGNLDYKCVGYKKHYTTHFFSDVICSDMIFVNKAKKND
tara:strand:+ start:3276 stop:4034 length:759 start_codon:yes stop_codon:yes gene_type:complete